MVQIWLKVLKKKKKNPSLSLSKSNICYQVIIKALFFSLTFKLMLTCHLSHLTQISLGQFLISIMKFGVISLIMCSSKQKKKMVM